MTASLDFSTRGSNPTIRRRRMAAVARGARIGKQAKHLADILLAEAPNRPFRYNQ